LRRSCTTRSSLILDEPTSGLDRIRQHDVLELIRARAATGRTVFLSSHEPTKWSTWPRGSGSSALAPRAPPRVVPGWHRSPSIGAQVGSHLTCAPMAQTEGSGGTRQRSRSASTSRPTCRSRRPTVVQRRSRSTFNGRASRRPRLSTGYRARPHKRLVPLRWSHPAVDLILGQTPSPDRRDMRRPASSVDLGVCESEGAAHAGGVASGLTDCHSVPTMRRALARREDGEEPLVCAR
jgi:hypothetical protein